MIENKKVADSAFHVTLQHFDILSVAVTPIDRSAESLLICFFKLPCFL
jgi:hypothetical protein